MSGFGPFQAPPLLFPSGQAGGGVLAGKQRPETRIRKAGRGGVLEASTRPSSPPGGLKHGLEQKGSPKYLRGYPFQSDLTLMVLWLY
jgi:hypothetical protein